MSKMTPAVATDPFARLPALPPDDYATHEVMNQATPLVGHNAFAGDKLLPRLLSARRFLGARAPD